LSYFLPAFTIRPPASTDAFHAGCAVGAIRQEKQMSDPFESTKPKEIARFIGKHFIYTYENGWQYEIYVKNERTIDYRIHGGLVGGRWVRDQETHIVRLAPNVFKMSWDEPTGTTVSVTINVVERRLHGVIFFPQ
jgi:phenolic acid decarboxylase